MIINLNDTDVNRLIWETPTMSHGIGLFETILLVRGKPIFLKEHLKRLNQSLDFLGIEGQITLNMLKKELLEIDSNILHQVLKIIVYGHMKDGYLQIIVTPYPYTDQKMSDGLAVKLTTSIQATTNPLNYHKTINYLERRLLLQGLKEEGFDEGIRINQFDRITEGTKTNVFIFNGIHWLTPPLTEGILDGICRQWLMETLRSKGEVVAEAPIAVEDFNKSELTVVTNSLIGCAHVSTNHPKPLSQLLLIHSLSKDYRGGFYGCT